MFNGCAAGLGRWSQMIRNNNRLLLQCSQASGEYEYGGEFSQQSSQGGSQLPGCTGTSILSTQQNSVPTSQCNEQVRLSPLSLIPDSGNSEEVPDPNIDELLEEFLDSIPQSNGAAAQRALGATGADSTAHNTFSPPGATHARAPDEVPAYSSEVPIQGSFQENIIPRPEAPVLCPPPAVSPRQQLASRISSRRGLEKSGLPQRVLEPSRVADGRSLALMVTIEAHLGKLAKQLSAMQQKLSLLEKSSLKTQNSLQPIEKKCSQAAATSETILSQLSTGALPLHDTLCLQPVSLGVKNRSTYTQTVVAPSDLDNLAKEAQEISTPDDEKGARYTAPVATSEGEPETNYEAPEKWIECTVCTKWRKVPYYLKNQQIKKDWACIDNIWDEDHQDCSVPQALSDAQIDAKLALQKDRKGTPECVRRQDEIEKSFRKLQSSEPQDQRKDDNLSKQRNHFGNKERLNNHPGNMLYCQRRVPALELEVKQNSAIERTTTSSRLFDSPNVMPTDKREYNRHQSTKLHTFRGFANIDTKTREKRFRGDISGPAIKNKRRRKYVGSFPTIEEVTRACNAAAREISGPLAVCVMSGNGFKEDQSSKKSNGASQFKPLELKSTLQKSATSCSQGRQTDSRAAFVESKQQQNVCGQRNDKEYSEGQSHFRNVGDCIPASLPESSLSKSPSVALESRFPLHAISGSQIEPHNGEISRDLTRKGSIGKENQPLRNSSPVQKALALHRPQEVPLLPRKKDDTSVNALTTRAGICRNVLGAEARSAAPSAPNVEKSLVKSTSYHTLSRDIQQSAYDDTKRPCGNSHDPRTVLPVAGMTPTNKLIAGYNSEGRLHSISSGALANICDKASSSPLKLAATPLAVGEYATQDDRKIENSHVLHTGAEHDITLPESPDYMQLSQIPSQSEPLLSSTPPNGNPKTQQLAICTTISDQCIDVDRKKTVSKQESLASQSQRPISYIPPLFPRDTPVCTFHSMEPETHGTSSKCLQQKAFQRESTASPAECTATPLDYVPKSSGTASTLINLISKATPFDRAKGAESERSTRSESMGVVKTDVCPPSTHPGIENRALSSKFKQQNKRTSTSINGVLSSLSPLPSASTDNKTGFNMHTEKMKQNCTSAAEIQVSKPTCEPEGRAAATICKDVSLKQRQNEKTNCVAASSSDLHLQSVQEHVSLAEQPVERSMDIGHAPHQLLVNAAPPVCANTPRDVKRQHQFSLFKEEHASTEAHEPPSALQAENSFVKRQDKNLTEDGFQNMVGSASSKPSALRPTSPLPMKAVPQLDDFAPRPGLFEHSIHTSNQRFVPYGIRNGHYGDVSHLPFSTNADVNSDKAQTIMKSHNIATKPRDMTTARDRFHSCLAPTASQCKQQHRELWRTESELGAKSPKRKTVLPLRFKDVSGNVSTEDTKPRNQPWKQRKISSATFKSSAMDSSDLLRSPPIGQKKTITCPINKTPMDKDNISSQHSKLLSNESIASQRVTAQSDGHMRPTVPDSKETRENNVRPMRRRQHLNSNRPRTSMSSGGICQPTLHSSKATDRTERAIASPSCRSRDPAVQPSSPAQKTELQGHLHEKRRLLYSNPYRSRSLTPAWRISNGEESLKILQSNESSRRIQTSRANSDIKQGRVDSLGWKVKKKA